MGLGSRSELGCSVLCLSPCALLSDKSNVTINSGQAIFVDTDMNKLIDLVLIHLNDKDIYSRLNVYSGI